MLKQLVTNSSILALLLTSSTAVAKTEQATPRLPQLQALSNTSVSQRTTTSTPDSSKASPSPGEAMSVPDTGSSSTRICKLIPIPRPSVGGTRERIEAIQRCNKARSMEQKTPTTSPTSQSDLPSEMPMPTSK